jgi:hypothetical protein
MAPGFRQNRGPIPKKNRTLIRILGGTPHYNTGEKRDQFHRNDDNVLLYPFESDRRIVAFKNRTWSRPYISFDSLESAAARPFSLLTGV